MKRPPDRKLVLAALMVLAAAGAAASRSAIGLNAEAERLAPMPGQVVARGERAP